MQDRYMFRAKRIGNEEWIEEIRKRCEAATPGPWCSIKNEVRRDYEVIDGGEIIEEVDDIAECFMPNDGCPLDNADFIAHSITDIPALLDALEGRDTMFYALQDNYNKALDELEADRDRWEARAEAFENFFKDDENEPACFACQKAGKGGVPCDDAEDRCPGFVFDQARFEKG